MDYFASVEVLAEYADGEIARCRVRIAAEEIALALAELRRPNRAQAMHNTRKSLKRLRSLLRSLRVAFPKNLFRQENRRLAAAGRKIAGEQSR